MSGLGKYASLLSDLDIDPAQFPHGTVEQFIDTMVDEYRFQQSSIRPLIQSRALVMREHDGEAFRIAVSGSIAMERDNRLNAHCRKIETLASAGSMHEAIAIAADLRKYYLRHYPGRCHRNTGESNFATYKPDLAHVYIAFFDKSQCPPRDGF
jgi:hypothetical protein